MTDHRPHLRPILSAVFQELWTGRNGEMHRQRGTTSENEGIDYMIGEKPFRKKKVYLDEWFDFTVIDHISICNSEVWWFYISFISKTTYECPLISRQLIQIDYKLITHRSKITCKITISRNRRFSLIKSVRMCLISCQQWHQLATTLSCRRKKGSHEIISISIPLWMAGVETSKINM